MADKNIEDFIDQQMAQGNGAPAPSAPSDIESSIDQQIHKQELLKKYPNDPNAQARAAFEEIGRGATFGLSDVASRAMGVKPEELAARKEGFEQEHPILGPGLQVVGGAIPLVATGGLAAPAEALVGEGLGATLLSSGAEGAAFGAGSAISDASLGDPNLNAQKVISDIGMGALMGVGAGAALHGAGKFLGNYGSIKGSLADSIDSEGAAAARGSSSADAVLNDGNTSMIKGADDLRDAGSELGVQPTNAMLSADEGKLIATDTLLKGPPTAAALRQKKIYSDIYNKVGESLQGIAPATEMSENEFGHVLQNSLASHIDEEAAPYAEMYGKIKQVTENIPIKQSSLDAIAKNIEEIKEVKTGFNSPAAKFARDVAEEIRAGNLENVDDLRGYQTYRNQSLNSLSSPSEKRIAGMVVDKLDDLERRTIKKYAQDFVSKVDMSNPQEAAIWGDKVRDIGQSLKNIDSADAQYSPFREKINGLMGWLGKNKVSGPKDATSFIRNDLEPEDIVRNLWSKKYAGLPQYLDKNFPEQAAMIKQYQKGMIQKESIKDGIFDVNKFLKKVNSLTKEQKEFLFFPDEIKKLDSATKLMNRFPKAFNYSNTSHASAWRSFFQNEDGHLRSYSEYPGMLAANVRDAAMEKYVNRAVGTKAKTARVDQKISENIDSILKTGSEGGF